MKISLGPICLGFFAILMLLCGIFAFFSTGDMDKLTEEEVAALPSVCPLPILIVGIISAILIVGVVFLKRCKNGKTV